MAAFEGVQITRFTVFTALTTDTLSTQTIFSGAGSYLSIIAVHLYAHFKSENFCDANFSMAGTKRAEIGDTLRRLPWVILTRIV